MIVKYYYGNFILYRITKWQTQRKSFTTMNLHGVVYGIYETLLLLLLLLLIP
jgi:hypothetical protein